MEGILTAELDLWIGHERFRVVVQLDPASPTLQRLESLLPWESEGHYAKVAGEEIVSLVPFVLPLENVGQVDDLETGSLCYWPDRAVLCLYYGPSAEVETVTVIGKVIDDKTRLRRAGEAIRSQQGAMIRLEKTRE